AVRGEDERRVVSPKGKKKEMRARAVAPFNRAFNGNSNGTTVKFGFLTFSAVPV
ncbi:hypothetical protein TorRG33x02_160720, partial [Trema orientale]